MAHLYQTIFHRHHLYKFEEDDESNAQCIYHIMLEKVFELLSKKITKIEMIIKRHKTTFFLKLIN